MQINHSEKRLKRFYGDIARLQNRDIINLITGEKILDIGSGYGDLVNQIKQEKNNSNIIGIDIDKNASKIAKSLYDLKILDMSAFKIEFPDNYFDTVILREVIHHLMPQDNLKLALKEIKRVCKKELIIFDPNPNWIVRLSRKIIRHSDPEAPLEIVIKVLKDSGFEIKHCKWRDVIAFPLSGGFVSREIVPNISFFKKMIIRFDSLLNIILSTLCLQKYFCWRYLIFATKVEAS